MDMAMWRSGRRNIDELNAWQKADEFSTLLHDVCRDLNVGRDKEWLIYLLNQAGRLMRDALEEGWNRTYLAEYLLGISEALTFVALIDYYLVFLRHEGYLSVERAKEVEGKLSDIQDELTALTGRLREELRASPEGTLSSFPWSLN
jgi:23S rRNA-intervening sequence protein